MVHEYTLVEIDRIAEQLIDSFTHSIVAMSGQMGSGKTTLVQSIVSQLGSEETVSSPTFGLVHEYNIPNGKLIHMDLYRLEQESELEQLGFDDYISTCNLCLIEWPELALKHIQGGYHHLNIEWVNDHKRKLYFK
jgi:tRNA threonylcarbamoyladenosine biosynthesis protein TsaE